MAKGGGGSWKVAYADFVTAMMAFFLVMWIGAQDVKVRQSVANYFIDPSGVSKMPTKSGAIMDTTAPGSVSAESKVETGRGVRPPGGDTPSPTTAAVINWLTRDEKRSARWKAEAERCRQAARVQQAVNETRSPDEIAATELTLLLKSEVTGNIPGDTPDVYKDLLFGSFNEVNWRQAAMVLLKD